MASIETNNDDWRELRTRVDSIANAIFLIAGGALSLSIPVILSNKNETFVTLEVATLASWAWYCLSCAMVLFLILKMHLVLEAYLLQMKTAFVNQNLAWLNGIGWFFGCLGFSMFTAGFFLVIRAAVVAVQA